MIFLNPHNLIFSRSLALARMLVSSDVFRLCFAASQVVSLHTGMHFGLFGALVQVCKYLQLLECCHINQHKIDDTCKQQMPRFSLPSVQLQPLVSKVCDFFRKNIMNLNHVVSLWRGPKCKNMLEETRQ